MVYSGWMSSTTFLQVLIKKTYGDRQKRHKMRNWKIRHLDKENSDMEVSKNVQEQDYAEFLENIEEDLSYRKNVNVYFSKSLLHLPTRSNDNFLVQAGGVATETACCPSQLQSFYMNFFSLVILDPGVSAIKQEGVAADAPQISMEEMLKELSIHDSDMAQD